MKHKFAVVASTVMIFVAAMLLSGAWLLRVRYFVVHDINGVENGETKSELYEYVNGVLEENYKNKWIFTFKEKDVREILGVNPYVEITEVKKVFPDRLEITMLERKERFALLCDNKYYVTDSKYYLLRVADKLTDTEIDNLKTVNVKNIEGFDLSKAMVGEKISSYGGLLFESMTTIFETFSDGLNFVKSIEIDGEKNVVDYQTQTGVIINVSFSVASVDNPNDTDKKTVCEKICLNANLIDSLYQSLSEREKRFGYIRVYEMTDGTVAVNYEPIAKEGGNV